MMIFEDNQSMIVMTKAHNNIAYQSRCSLSTTLFKIRCPRDQASKGAVQVTYYPTSDMIADTSTKGLANDSFEKLQVKMGVTHQVFWQVRRNDGTIHSTRTQFNVLS